MADVENVICFVLLAPRLLQILFLQVVQVDCLPRSFSILFSPQAVYSWGIRDQDTLPCDLRF
jgi:hypothetical protein